MSNTTQEKIDMNRTIIEGVKALITNRIHECISYVGLGEPTAITSLDLIP